MYGFVKSFAQSVQASSGVASCEIEFGEELEMLGKELELLHGLAEGNAVPSAVSAVF